ncbi:hypothetical protein CHU95_02010 [Niveispirillum lacus]|uniref:Uncharacterized protein n=1 Tax=Niveispirillum lacus TaxID=1981099 RepID=A0A255Z8C0_9PROT|nr:hypothetical protein [Niveispirillum lacus]OYQ37144.1 hypothetical protein CHU95_02010 [Niveispirillum lacus]
MQREKLFCFIQQRQGGPGIALRNIVKPVEADGFKIRLPDPQQVGGAQQGINIPDPDSLFQTAQKPLAQRGQIILQGRRPYRCGPAEMVKGRAALAGPPQSPARQAAPSRHLSHRHPIRQRQRHRMPPRLIQGTGFQSWKTRGLDGFWCEVGHENGSPATEDKILFLS